MESLLKRAIIFFSFFLAIIIFNIPPRWPHSLLTQIILVPKLPRSVQSPMSSLFSLVSVFLSTHSHSFIQSHYILILP